MYMFSFKNIKFFKGVEKNCYLLNWWVVMKFYFDLEV